MLPGHLLELLRLVNVLTWEATNAVIGTISPVSQSGDDPVFDFSGNDGTPILVTATSSDGFNGFSRLDLWNNMELEVKLQIWI